LKIRKAIIPAAGLGTRFLPATKAQPKEMLPIVDKPSIQYIIEEAVASGIEDVIIVTGKNKRAIEDHFDRSPELESLLEKQNKLDLLDEIVKISNLIDIHYIRQKQALGLGHAIHCARKFIGNEPFAVLLGDDIVESDPPALQQMMQLYEQHQTSIVAVQQIPWEEVNKYGIIHPINHDKTPLLPGDISAIYDLIEKPERALAPSNLAIIGRYIIEPEIFHFLEKAQPGSKGEIQLTDSLRDLNRVKQMIAYSINGKRYDTGDKLGYMQASIEFALRRPEMREPLTEYILSLASTLQTYKGGNS
jgi:UTP--glucose-1-phosphate uridylyltransferase